MVVSARKRISPEGSGDPEWIVTPRGNTVSETGSAVPGGLVSSLLSNCLVLSLGWDSRKGQICVLREAKTTLNAHWTATQSVTLYSIPQIPFFLFTVLCSQSSVLTECLAFFPCNLAVTYGWVDISSCSCGLTACTNTLGFHGWLWQFSYSLETKKYVCSTQNLRDWKNKCMYSFCT